MGNALSDKFFSQILLVILMISFISHSVSAYDYYQDQELVENSKQKINEVFINLYVAQTAGADITIQLNKLRTISEYFYNVKYLKQEEATDEKLLEIETKVSELYQLYDETQNMRKITIAEQINLEKNLLLTTFIKLVVFMILTYGIYRYTGQREKKKILGYKPELGQ